MSDELTIERIISEIKEETGSIIVLSNEYKNFLEKYPFLDRYLLRTKASFLADFYMGVERIFKIIAEELNGGTPKGEDWHKRLLLDMSLNIGERPPVISRELHGSLLMFLGFRHVVRQVYGFELDEKRLEALSVHFEPVLEKFIKEMEGFCQFLKDRVKKGDVP
ncbi:MAG TPA: hypothetical protein ACFYEF_04215 [Candidatus Wunengus sp. YC63]|uniref:ribonuclease toxin HepT-like protein n=1 Tax=unclassified Candidatus Wunengus TaxID=3367695 RepID=UPI0040256BF5